MCYICSRQTMGRRQFLAFAGLGLAAGSTLFGIAQAAAAAHGPTTSVTAEQALANLKSGNDKYVTAPDVCSADLAKRRTGVANSQTPWATIVSCADSRVPPELLFGGLGVGELFVARNAGNMVDTATMGTIEYGAEHLGAPLVVVLGHESCGAVAAACDVLIKNAKLDGSMGPMVQPIVEVAKTLAKSGTCDVDAVIRESAIRTAKKVAGSPVLAHKKTKVVAARYDLDNGKVEFL